MKDETIWDYMKRIEMTDAAIRRAQKIIGEYRGLLSEDLEDLFITDHLDGEQVRRQKNLWLFTKNFIHECKSFLTESSLDFVRMNQKSIQHLYIKSSDFEGGVVTDKSKLNVNFNINFTLGAALEAVRNNCPHLMKLFMERFRPNI